MTRGRWSIRLRRLPRAVVAGRLPSALTTAGLTLVAAGGVGLALSPDSVAGPPVTAVASADPPSPPGRPGAPTAGSWTSPSLSRAALPVGLSIPAIGVHTGLVRLGRTASGALQVPDSFEVAGWYDLGPRPGEPGPAVIAGHVDSVSGPAVFYRLGDLRAGDRIYVRRADSSVVIFAVTGVLMYPKSGFPADSVYGPVAGPQLRLITCGGTFDYTRRSYLSNVVVYATET